MDGVLILVIPFERLHDCTEVLSSHFASLRVFRMTDPDSVQYRQIAVFGIRHEVRGLAVENNRRQLQSIGLCGSFLELAELEPGVCVPYSVPSSGESTLNYRGLPYDILEDLLPMSGAWTQAAPLLMPPPTLPTAGPSHRCMAATLASYAPQDCSMASSERERTGTSPAGVRSSM